MPYNPLSGSAPVGQLGWRAPLVFLLPSPVLVAHASMPTPALIIAIAIQPSSMAATAIFRVPGVSSSDLLTAPISLATAAMLAPTVNVFSVITAAPPAMAASAAMLAPTIGKGVGITAPLLQASAAMLAPTVTTLNPVALDAVGPGASTASGTSLSWTHTGTTGATVLVDMVIAGSATPTVTYGGVTMTPVSSIALNNTGSTGSLRRYRLTNIPGGAQTVSATWSGNVVAIGNSISYKNVVTIGATTSTFGQAASVSQAATCITGQMLVQSFGAGSGSTTAWSAIAGGTNRYNAIAGTVTKFGLLISDATANATFTANTGVSDSWGGLNTVLSPT